MKELIAVTDKHNLVVEKPDLAPMVKEINKTLPEIHRAKENFCKRQSQMMDNMLTVHHPTPLRNLRQITAEVEKIEAALKENYFTLEKQKIEMKIKLRDAEQEQDELKRELMYLEADEMQNRIIDSEKYISGSVRKLRNYTEQYNSIAAMVMKEQGITEFSEIDFEREEEKYHIMTAFSQARNALLSRGVIDEGNQIYLQQLGINGHVALKALQGFAMIEEQMMKEGKEPTNQMWLDFMEDMYQKFKGSTDKMAAHKGMTTFVEEATVSPKLLEK